MLTWFTKLYIQCFQHEELQLLILKLVEKFVVVVKNLGSKKELGELVMVQLDLLFG